MNYYSVYVSKVVINMLQKKIISKQNIYTQLYICISFLCYYISFYSHMLPNQHKILKHIYKDKILLP